MKPLWMILRLKDVSSVAVNWLSTRRSVFASGAAKCPQKNVRNQSFYRPGQMLRWYTSYFFEARPCFANALNTALVMGLGDVLAQTLLESKRIRDFDFQRTIRFVGIGGCLAGPGMCFWYSALDKYVVRGTKASMTLRKILLDQVLFLPIYLLVYFVVLAAFRGDGPEEIRSRLSRDMYPGLVDSYKIWPLAQALNFYLLPLKFRVIFINIIALFWNTYIGWKAEQKLESAS